MSGKQPFLPLFFGDFLASTAEWAGEEQALYLLLLGHQWSLGSIPADVEKVRRLARWERKAFNAAWATVAEKFPEHDGRRQNARLEQHRSYVHERSERRSKAGKDGAAARWQKDDKPDGNANAVATETDGNRNAVATDLPREPSHPIPTQEEEPTTTLMGRGKGSSSIKTLREALGKSFSQEGSLSPPQEPQENGHDGLDARSFETIKENVAALAERLQTQDPERIHKLAGQSHRLSRRQCEAAVKQLREDGFFNRMAIA